MKGKRELITHILMVVAPLLMLFVLTIAWFVNTRTTDLAPMSFASQDTGPGATLYRATEIKDWSYNGTVTPHTVTNTVVWASDPEKPEESDITLQNMTPGQSDYYLLLSNTPFSVRFHDVKFFDQAGKPLGEGVPPPLLAQCLGFYLIPLTDTTSTWAEAPPTQSIVTSHLLRAETSDGTIGQLQSTLLREGQPTAPLPVAGTTGEAGTYADTYVLAIYLDPLYLQGTADAPAFLNELVGQISFSLTYQKEESTVNE